LTPDSWSASAAEAPPETPPKLPSVGVRLSERALPGRRRSWLLLAAVLVAVVELVMAVTRIPFYARIGHANLERAPMLVRDADVDPFAYYDATLAMVAAQEAIPRDATYTIVTGREFAGRTMPRGLAIAVYRFWLAPRGYTPDIKKAEWALTYYKASEYLGVPYTDEIGLGPGVNAVRLGAKADG
jgi:hypothetical protein